MSVNGNRPNPNPSEAKVAKPLDPDLLPWLRQNGESHESYERFLLYRDAKDRNLSMFGPDRSQVRKARDESSGWSWGYRALEWDRYLGNVDTDEMVKYRREMAERQRATARLAQQKIANWLINLDENTLKPGDAARWYEVAVRVEREAAGAEQTSEPGAKTDDTQGRTLAELIGIDPSVEDALVAGIAAIVDGG